MVGKVFKINFGGVLIINILKKLANTKPIIFLDQLLFRIKDDEVFASGAHMAFFLILSIFPFIIMLLNIMSYTPFVKPDILQNIISYLPGETQKIFQNFIKEITASSSQSLLSISAIAGIWSSSSGIKAVIRAIDKAYDHSESRSYIKLRIMSFFFTIALLLLIILVFSTLIFGEVLANKLFTALGLNFFFSILWAYVRILIPLVYMILIFALLYKYSPSRKKSFKISFKNALPGAIFTTLGWMLTSILFSYYVNNFGSFALTYGSLVGIIVLFIWLYISSFIIVLGGEVNATLEFFRVHGCKINSNKSLISSFLNKT